MAKLGVTFSCVSRGSAPLEACLAGWLMSTTEKQQHRPYCVDVGTWGHEDCWMRTEFNSLPPPLLAPGSASLLSQADPVCVSRRQRLLSSCVRRVSKGSGLDAPEHMELHLITSVGLHKGWGPWDSPLGSPGPGSETLS